MVYFPANTLRPKWFFRFQWAYSGFQSFWILQGFVGQCNRNQHPKSCSFCEQLGLLWYMPLRVCSFSDHTDIKWQNYEWRCIYCIYVIPYDMVHKVLHWPSNKFPSKYWGFDFLDVSGKYPPGNFENWPRKFRQMRSRQWRGWDQKSLTSWMRMMKSIQRRRIYIDEKFWKVCISLQFLKCFTGWQFLSSEVLKEYQIIKEDLHDLSYF